MNSNKLLYILIGIIVVAVFFTVILVLRNIGGGAAKPVTLQFWGVFDDHNAFDKTISDFKAQNPGIDVKYRQLTYEEYESTLINNLAAGTGPDIVMIHNPWLAKHGDILAPAPAKPDGKNPFTIQNFKDQFVDVFFNDLIYNNQIYGLPLSPASSPPYSINTLF